jgi:4-hydroxybenzoate polyprenyltransferase
VNNEKYPREPLAAVGLGFIILLLVFGLGGAAQREWLLALLGFGAPILTYFFLPANQFGAKVREYATAIMGAVVVVGEPVLWTAADGSFFAVAVVAAVAATLYAVLYLRVRRWRRVP